jgi:hypothetical protein
MADRVLYVDDVTGKQKRGLPPSSFGAVTFGNTSTVNLTVDMFDELTADVVVSGILDDSITNGVVDKAPSQNAVFDALALKRDISLPSFADEDFDIAAPTSVLALASDITATTLIDVYINGILTREGATKTLERDQVNNEIEFNDALSVNSWVRVRIFT